MTTQPAQGRQPDELPAGWALPSLSELLQAGPTNGYSGPAGTPGRGTRTLSLSATTTGRMVLNTSTVKWLAAVIDADSDRLLRPGDVLVQRSNTRELVGTTAVYQGPDNTYAYPDLMMRLRFAEQSTAEWFWRFANGPAGRRYFEGAAAGSTGTMPKLSGNALRLMPVPLPPKRERERANAALLVADGLLAGLDDLLHKKRAVAQGARQVLLTGRTRLSPFATPWRPVELGRHVRFLKHGVYARADLTATGTVRYLHYGDIHAAATARLRVSHASLPFLPDPLAQPLSRLEGGDVVFVDASEDLAGVGKSVEVVNVDALPLVSGLHTIACRFDKSVLADGFKAYLQFIPSFVRHLRTLAAGTKVLATNRKHIANAVVELPGIEEQSAIAAVLSDLDAELEALEARRAKTLAIKQGMMQALLTGRIRLT